MISGDTLPGTADGEGRLRGRIGPAESGFPKAEKQPSVDRNHILDCNPEGLAYALTWPDDTG